jgi:hypothetical protein
MAGPDSRAPAASAGRGTSVVPPAAARNEPPKILSTPFKGNERAADRPTNSSSWKPLIAKMISTPTGPSVWREMDRETGEGERVRRTHERGRTDSERSRRSLPQRSRRHVLGSPAWHRGGSLSGRSSNVAVCSGSAACRSFPSLWSGAVCRHRSCQGVRLTSRWAHGGSS